MMTTTSIKRSDIDDVEKRLWDLRNEGIRLRDEGIQDKVDIEAWTRSCLDWENRFIEAANEFSPRLARRLRPLGSVDEEYNNIAMYHGIGHAKNVAAMSTIIGLFHFFVFGR